MTRILTGIQASGKPHIGNYFGMLQRAITQQENTDNECLYFIADMHAFTSKPEPEVFAENLRETVITWLALGLDPEKVIFYRQSDIRAHMEAYWLMVCQTPMGMLDRAHSFKDKKAKGLEANAGLYTYPVLMAMDILLYDAQVIPVGKDQKQHVEMARDLAQKWNHHYGETFVLPEPSIDENVETIPGLDGAKMSKSYGNTIEIFCTQKELKKKIMSIQTESLELGDPMNPDTCNVFRFHELFENSNLEELREQYKTGSIGFGHSKKMLLELVWDHFAPARARREELEKNPEKIEAILKKGAEKARTIAEAKLAVMREKIGLPPMI